MEQTDTTGTEAGQEPSGQEQPTPNPADTGAASQAPQPGTYTQKDLDAAAARARRDADGRAKAAEARLAELEAAEAERKKAEMTELDRAKAEAEEAKTAAEQARQEAARAALDAQRANILAADGADLPAAYKAMVTGTDAATIGESLAAARAQYETDRKAWIGQLATMSPEQVAALDTDEAKALAARLQGKPQSVGAPANAGGQTPPPPDPQAMNLRAVLADKGKVSPADLRGRLVRLISGH